MLLFFYISYENILKKELSIESSPKLTAILVKIPEI